MRISLVNNLHFDSPLDFKAEDPEVSAGRLVVSTPPLGILLLAAVVREEGHEVEVVDFADLARRGEVDAGSTFYPEAARYLAGRQADLVGFTSRCDDYHCQLRIADGLRGLAPRTPIVFGGPQATVTDRRTLELFPCVDYVVRNEGEETFPQLLAVLAAGGDLADVAGLTWRRGTTPVANLDRPLLQDLDSLPIPAYDLYTSDFAGRWPIEVGRGCPFSCTFCSTSVYFHRTYRLKTGQRLVEEMRYLRDRFGVQELTFIHDMLTANQRRVMAMCKAIGEADLGLRWSCSARMDCLGDELLDALRAAGCDNVYMGIEVGSLRMQKLLRKNLHLDRLEPAIATLKERGFSITTSFITGFEEESRDDVEQTLDLLLRCVLAGVEQTQLHLWAPQAGSVLFEHGRQRLEFDGYLSDQVDPLYFAEEDLDLIRSHPDLFGAFHFVPPRDLPRKLYQGLDLFGYACSYFPQTLFLALRTSGRSALEIFTGFQLWLSTERGVDLAVTIPPMRIFHGLLADYLEHLIESGVFTYPYLRDILRFNVAFTRFQHRRFEASEAAIGTATPPAWNEAFRQMYGHPDPETEILDFTCDIRRLIDAVNERRTPPDAGSLTRRTSIALRRVDSKVAILGLPVLCRMVLELCEGTRTLGEVEEIVATRIGASVPALKAAGLAAGALRQVVEAGLILVADINRGVIPEGTPQNLEIPAAAGG